MSRSSFIRSVVVLASLAATGPLVAESNLDAAARGYQLLTEKPYLPPDFDQETFDEIWQVWPEPLRSEAAAASAERRRELAFLRYGLTTRPGDKSGKPLQYVVDEQGQWTMNCFACHGGQVAGRVIPGAPNAQLALETLTEEIRQTKIRQQKKLSRMDLGSLVIPLGSTRGTTNAVIFGVGLMAFRDSELNLLPQRLPSPLVHHDMDAPAWWHISRKQQLYIDGFAPKGHRALMQFMLVPENGPKRFREWEADFRDVYAYLESLQPPDYPFPVNAPLAQQGQRLFEAHCADCHGWYGDESSYPELMVEQLEVGTDPVRLSALSVENRRRYRESWFGRSKSQAVVTNPVGYVAPPLDGLWATAPYLHNGSVPTLWHLLRPDRRPTVWRRTSLDFDTERVGLLVQQDASPSAKGRSSAEAREVFDTRVQGKSASGHDFPAQLSEQEKEAVLEYLKTM